MLSYFSIGNNPGRTSCWLHFFTSRQPDYDKGVQRIRKTSWCNNFHGNCKCPFRGTKSTLAQAITKGSSRKNPRNPGNEKNGFAKFTQRIGYQFPSWVVDKVKIKLGIHESTPDTARLNTATHKSGQDRKPKPSDRKHTRAEQNKLDEEAREALKDLFPFIPKKDTNAIVKHAFDLVS